MSTQTANVPTLPLNDGQVMRQLGYGVWQVSSEEIGPSVQAALDAGYRSIDTAMIYGNEEGVGRAMRDSGVPREEIFLATKLWSDRHADAPRGLDESLGRLGVEKVELYLIHWPRPKQGLYRQAWKGMVECQRSGKAVSIGVSNFTIEQLREIIDDTGVVPSVNQIELHPAFPQDELRAFHREHGIVTESYSPLGSGKFENPILDEIGAKYGKTAAQVVLRWHLDLGLVAIPKSVTPSRIRENIALFDFRLDADDLAKIATLETGERVGADPMVADW